MCLLTYKIIFPHTHTRFSFYLYFVCPLNKQPHPLPVNSHLLCRCIKYSILYCLMDEKKKKLYAANITDNDNNEDHHHDV